MAISKVPSTGINGAGFTISEATPANTFVTDSSGNVGIGTSSPVNTAGIKSLTVYAATDVPSLYLQNSTTGTAYTDGFSLGMSGTDVYFNNREAGNALFYVNGSERMRINSSGILLVNKTASSLQTNIETDSSSAGVGGYGYANTAASPTANAFYGNYGNGGNTSQLFFYGRAASADRIYIYGNGNIVNVNNSYGALSDAKLKENVVDATPKLEQLCQVKIRNFNYIGSETKQIGVVAQELEAIFPSMIEESPDRDEEGNVLETTSKSVKYSVFVPMLIKAIQELNAKVTALEAQLGAK